MKENTNMSYEKSIQAYNEAVNLMPGGVNSPVRAFKSVDTDPIFMEYGKGSKIYDIDGNEYIDYVLSWGPLILGHADDKVRNSLHEAVDKGTSFGASTILENKMAQLVIDRVPTIEMVRMVSSGTEATLAALRLARGFTGKNKILKFSILKFRKKSILFMLTIFIGLVSLYYITKSRSGDNSLRYTYYYFAMEPLMFEKWSKIVSQMGLIAYGMASFNGYIFSFFYLMVNAIPIFTYPESCRTIYAVIENIGTQWQTITTIGTTANSYTSIFWTLYFDGRVCGIIIGMFLFGIFTG